MNLGTTDSTRSSPSAMLPGTVESLWSYFLTLGSTYDAIHHSQIALSPQGRWHYPWVAEQEPSKDVGHGVWGERLKEPNSLHFLTGQA